MTNIEKIRSMDTFELANFLSTITNNCYRLADIGTAACSDCPLEYYCIDDDIAGWLETDINESKCIGD